MVDDDGLWRVRLGTKSTSKGAADYRETITTFLDGREIVSTLRGHTVRKKVLDMVGSNVPTTEQVVPARSSSLVDFGRLETAVLEFIRISAKFSPDNPPSDAQLTSLTVAYQNIVEWRHRARERMAHAEGQIELAEDCLKRLL